MRSFIVPCGLALLLLTGCSADNSNGSNSTGNSTNVKSSNTGSTSSSTPGSNTSGAAKAKGDFSTPKAAVETFISAGTSRDADLISRCFDAESPGEFRKLREKTASPKELDELATFVKGAQVLDAKETGDTARVSVKFNERNEEITMKKSADGWKIVDF
jgi:hypothetical protein